MARSRTLAARIDPDAKHREVLDASPMWRAEDERLELAERSMERLIDLEALVRAQRNVIDEATAEQRERAVHVLRELQDRADAAMQRLNALRFPPSASDSTSTVSDVRSTKPLSGRTVRLPGQVALLLGMYEAADLVLPPSVRRRRRQRTRR